MAAPEEVPPAVGRTAEDDPPRAPAPGLPNPLAPDPDRDPAPVLAPTPDLAPGIVKKSAVIFKLFFFHRYRKLLKLFLQLSPVGAGVVPDPGPEAAPAPDLAPGHDLQTSVARPQNPAVRHHRKWIDFCYPNPVRI